MSLRHDWTYQEVKNLFESSYIDLTYQAQSLHRQNFDPHKIQLSTLLSVKTGGCPEDCAYCPQSIRYQTGVKAEALMSEQEILAVAKKAKAAGATRFCMAAGWRSPPKRSFQRLLEVIKELKILGLETCTSLGLLNEEQAKQLEQAGLDFYNHNLDTSPDYYKKIISTRSYEDRLKTLAMIRNTNIKVCCGGIIGMGESIDDRIHFLLQLANMPKHPESVPINLLIKIPGTPFENQADIASIDFVKVIAIARILMPKTFVRLSAGRNTMSDELHALCFLAGANSIHFGEKLLVTPLPDEDKDKALLKSLGMEAL